MAGTLGTIRGQMILDVKQALAAYTQARQKHVATVTALRTGAGALTGVGAGITAVGAGMAAGLGLAVKAAADFERKLDYFGAVSNSTESDMEAVRKKALQLGADTIYSADQIADSFIELGKSGVSAKQIIEGVGEGVASLAAAADLPLDTAANIMLSAVQTFELGADKAVSVADKLSGAANASILDVQDLGVSFKYVGGVAHNLGFSFDETNTALALLGKYGIRGSTAGTSLRQTLVSLTGSSKAAENTLKDLGIITADGGNKFFDASGKAKPMGEIFDILRKSTANLSDEQRIQALKTIFQSRALSTVLALSKEGSKGFETMSAAINKTSAADVASKRLDNLSGDLEILRGNLDTLMVSFGSTVQGAVRGIVQGVTQIVQIFIDLPDPIKQAIVVGLAIVAVLLIIAGVAITVVGAILGFVATLFVLGPVISAVVGVVGTIISGIGAFGAALLAFLGPVGIVIAIIAVVVGALVWFFTQTEVGKVAWQEFCRFLAEAWANIVAVASDVWSGLVSFFSDLFAQIGAFFQQFGPLILAVIAPFIGIPLLIITHWNEIVAFFATLWTNIINGIVAFIAGVIGFFSALPGQIGAFFAQLPGMIGFAIGFLIGTVVRLLISLGTQVVAIGSAIVNNFVNFWTQLPGRVIAFVTQLVTRAVVGFNILRARVVAVAQQVVTNVVNFFQQLPGRVVAYVTQLVTRAVAGFNILRARVVAAAQQVVTNVVRFFQQLPGRVVAFVQQMVTQAVARFVQMRARAIAMAQGLINGVRGIISGLPGLVSGIFNRAVAAIQGVVRNAFNAAASFAKGLWEGFKNGLGIHSPSYIEHAMWAITDVTGTETDRLRGQVSTMKGLAVGITKIGQGIGQGWGDGVDTGLQDLYQMVGAARQLENDIAKGNGFASTLGVDAAAQRALLAANANAAAAGGTETNFNTTIVNPEPERASDSLPRSIRQTAYMVGS